MRLVKSTPAEIEDRVIQLISDVTRDKRLDDALYVLGLVQNLLPETLIFINDIRDESIFDESNIIEQVKNILVDIDNVLDEDFTIENGRVMSEQLVRLIRN